MGRRRGRRPGSGGVGEGWARCRTGCGRGRKGMDTAGDATQEGEEDTQTAGTAGEGGK